MTRNCTNLGLLVCGDTRLAEDPHEFWDEAGLAPVGCGLLRCGRCGEWVRIGPPGWTLRPDAVVDATTLLTAPDWTALPSFVETPPGPRNESRPRYYACGCARWEATRDYVLGNERDSENDPDLPWTCGGHPAPVLPLQLGEVEISESADWRRVVRQVLGGACPRPLALPNRLGDGPGKWLCWLFAYLRNLPGADALSSAIAEALESRDPSVVGRVLFFFQQFPMAAGLEALVTRAENDAASVALGYPIPERQYVPTLWDVLTARIAKQSKADPLKARVVAVLKKAMVTPLAGLSHANLGTTDLVEIERERRIRDGWQPGSEMWHQMMSGFEALAKAERIDVVTNELERSPGALDDQELREFIADHIIQIDVAGPGRWKAIMNRLCDWFDKPATGHLIVIAASRLIQSGIVTKKEFRSWIAESGQYGWKDDAWVLPVEAMLGS